MRMKWHNNSWMGLLSPVAWLVVKVLETIFHRAWTNNTDVPFSNGSPDLKGPQK